MTLLTVFFSVVTLIAAIVVFWILIRGSHHSHSHLFGAGIASVAILAISLGGGAGSSAILSKISIESQLTFKEMWNGFELAAESKTVTCVIDGSCRHTYDCDPYTELVTKTRSVTGADGKTTTETYTELETKYRSCPYSKEETSFWVTTTLDDVSYGDRLMTGEPYRWGKRIPGGQVPVPADWVAAKDRIAAGKPQGITEVHKYKNFILASNDEMFKKNPELIADLMRDNLLPDIAVDTQRGFANKFRAVEVNAGDSFSIDVANLNGAMAMDKKFGDLHVVAIDSDRAGSPDDYTNALSAYWSSTDYFGKNALPKNAVVVVMGVSSDDKTVEWARSFTGMPMGNEGFMQTVSSQLKDVPFDSKLIGRPHISKDQSVIKSEGVLEEIIWDSANGFQRVSMSGDGIESAGFLYLGSSITPTTGYIVTAGILWTLLLGGAITLSLVLRDRLFDLGDSIDSKVSRNR